MDIEVCVELSCGLVDIGVCVELSSGHRSVCGAVVWT